jgi:hypothetical protein
MHWRMLESAMHRMKIDGEDPNLFGPANRRREARMPLTFPIEVSGFDRRGHFFTEQSSCSDVGEASCAFRLRTEVPKDAVLAIRSFHWQNNNVLDSRPVLFQVARVEGENDRTNHGADANANAETQEARTREAGTREADTRAAEARTSGPWIVAVVRLKPEQPQRNHQTENIESAVS